MSLFHRGVIVPLVALALGAAPLGCASPGAPDEDDLATAAADGPVIHEDLASAAELTAEQQAKLVQLRAEQGPPAYERSAARGPSREQAIEQIVRWFTTNLDLTPAQAAKLRAYLETHAPSGPPTHP